MGYFINGIIGYKKKLNNYKKKYKNINIIKLKQKLSLIPLDKLFLNELGMNEEDIIRDINLENLLKVFSNDSLIVYIEAEYFGGNGSQSSIIYKNGVKLNQFINIPNAINDCLKCFNIKKDKKLDIFESLGLNKYRKIEDWINDIEFNELFPNSLIDKKSFF